jgi:hypothetical protein
LLLCHIIGFYILYICIYAYLYVRYSKKMIWILCAVCCVLCVVCPYMAFECVRVCAVILILYTLSLTAAPFLD